MWKKSFFILLLVSVLIIGFAGYAILDQGVTLTHMDHTYKRTVSDLLSIIDYAKIQGKKVSKDKLIETIRENKLKEQIFIKGSSVYMGDIIFEFDDQEVLKNIYHKYHTSEEDISEVEVIEKGIYPGNN